MELTFPFQNIAYNTFQDFFSNDFINSFTGYSNFFEPNQESLEKELADFRGHIADYENEILQIINTSNQETIDLFLTRLCEIDQEINYINSDIIVDWFYEYNKTAYQDFLERVKTEEEEYFKKPERYKYKHLEKYKTYISTFLDFSKLKEIERTNYNYYCIERGREIADLSYLESYVDFVLEAKSSYSSILHKYLNLYDSGEIKARTDKFFTKIIVYVEGDLDIMYLRRAAELLGYESIFDKIELRQRGGYRNLDKIWSFYKENSVEITPQKKLLLYDCDTQKQDESFGLIYKTQF